MRKLIASVALVSAVVVGGLAVAAVNPIQLVSAKSSPETSAATTTASAAAARRSGKLLDRALASVVAKGTITKDQAAAVKSAIQRTAKEYRAEHKTRRQMRRRNVVQTSAKAIGITPKDLVAGVKSGKSIAQVAQANGVEPQTVIQALVTAGNARTDAAVKAGKLTAARAAKIKERLPDLADRVVNRLPRHHT